eukprot:7387810-Prymnesium_polylepis.1
MCTTTDGQPSTTAAKTWFKANARNSGGASAICMLTASALFHSLGGAVPVGAVESCVSGTNYKYKCAPLVLVLSAVLLCECVPQVEPWTPPGGSLWQANMVPLLPMTFKAALWDQGEADAKRTSSDWYRVEFPKMIQGWRAAFESPGLPFLYVELCTEYGAEEPKESDFWLAQRAATALPNVDFAVTTDLQRALHPPDKQAVIARLLLGLQRVAYGLDVASRGPELVSTMDVSGGVELTFSNESLTVH